MFFGSDHTAVSISKCIFESNTGEYGGAIYLDQFSYGVSLTSSLLKRNVAKELGGAVFTLASELSMYDCDLLTNIASSGAGLYQPSNMLVHFVNLTFCRFDGNLAANLYASVFVELASRVTIQSCSFSGNKETIASAVGVKRASFVFIENCSFTGNVANSSAGAVYLESGYDNFERNIAILGSGSAIYLTSSTQVTIQNNRFVNNSADSAGGTIYWVVSSNMIVPVGLASTGSNVLFGNFYQDNTALFGNNVATDANSLTLSEENTYAVIDYDAYVPAIDVYLVDYYGQIVRIESSGAATASVLTTTKCYDGSVGYVTGGYIAPIQSGTVQFNELGAFCDPGYSMRVNITSSVDSIEVTSFTLNFRPCQRGEYYQDNICRHCESGTYSLTDPTDVDLVDLEYSDVCKPCPKGADSCLGDTIVLKKGYWRISESSSSLLECPYGELACLGGNSSGNAICHKGFKGTPNLILYWKII